MMWKSRRHDLHFLGMDSGKGVQRDGGAACALADASMRAAARHKKDRPVSQTAFHEMKLDAMKAVNSVAK